MSRGTEASYRERIFRVCLHIEANLDQPISLEALAGVACFSPFHFHRIFRALVGESVMEHVRRLRLERAAQRLRAGPPARVIDVALDAGYETHEAFTRAFRGMFGVVPSRYRRSRPRPARHLSAETPDPKTPLAVRFERLPPIRAAFMRHVGPYADVGPTFDRLLDWAGNRGLLAGPPPLVFGLSLDDPDVTAPERLRYDACVAVPARITAEDGEIGIHDIPAREYAAVTFTGPYEELDDVYRWLCGAWPPRSGREVGAAPCLEFYRNDPKTTPPAELVTDVLLPLEPAGPASR